MFAPLSWKDSYLARVLSCGPVPRHVALLGDGNRRWARERGLNAWDGQDVGLENYLKQSRFFFALGCPEVTLFLFGMDNFKRSEEEVTKVLELVHKLVRLATEIAEELKIQVRILGEKSLLPQSLQEQIELTEQVTSGYDSKFILNLAVPYGSRYDITRAIKELTLKSDSCEINEDQLEKALCTAQCGAVDLLIRTSGETRLSDFFSWEVSVKRC